MPEQQEEKEAMKTMIYNTLQYVQNDDGDFGYTISDTSKAKIRDLLEQFQNDVQNDVINIGEEIKRFYLQEENELKNITAFLEKIKLAEQKISKIEGEKDPQLFKDRLFDAISFLNIHISTEYLEGFKIKINFANFLKPINIRFSNSFEMFNGMKNIINYLSESQKWYKSLINLHDDFSKADMMIKDNTNNARSFMNSLDRIISPLNGNEDVDFSEGGVFYDKLNRYGLVGMRVSSFKLKALNAIISQTLNYNIQRTCDWGRKLLVKGYNVKMTDVLKEECDAKIIEIFALNKIFINTNINKLGGVTVVIIAPVWEIYGEIYSTLNGHPGESFVVDAGNGTGRSDGKMGMPGHSGGPSGHFVGIGDTFINDNSLSIFAYGGTGGKGQNGGKGEMYICYIIIIMVLIFI